MFGSRLVVGHDTVEPPEPGERRLYGVTGGGPGGAVAGDQGSGSVVGGRRATHRVTVAVADDKDQSGPLSREAFRCGTTGVTAGAADDEHPICEACAHDWPPPQASTTRWVIGVEQHKRIWPCATSRGRIPPA